MNNLAYEQGENQPSHDLPVHWFASIAPAPPSHHIDYNVRLISSAGYQQGLYIGTKLDSQEPRCVTRASCGMVFAGTLYNGVELSRELGDLVSRAEIDDAELILECYLKWGEKVLPRLRGMFALVISDNTREVSLCLRDPIGTYPLFYTRTQNGVLVSPSPHDLTRQPGVSAEVNRVALADLLVTRFPSLEETYFEAIKRVPPGYVLRLAKDGPEAYRYWDPAPDGEVKWLAPDEVERFDELFDRAVERCLNLGPAGIYLSGGLDSVSVAAIAADRSSSNGYTTPWALSMVFPDPDVNEEAIQRGVASRLGLPLVLKKFDDAVAKEGFLGGAIRLNNYFPSPIINTWLPAYYALAREGVMRGCKTILTGTGGDEWLNVSPMLGADMLRKFDIAGFYHLWQTSRRSFRRPEHSLLRAMLWTFGLGPLVIPPVHRIFRRYMPWALRARRQAFQPLPKWLAPDPELRKNMQSRWEQRSLRESHSSKSFYITEMKLGLDHPLVSWESEEWFDFGQMAGARILHPMWDPDLVDLLYRTPPLMLLQDRRTKGLVRATVARRFPNLGFERQYKVEGTRYYSELIYKEIQKIWDNLSGAPTLAKLGIVDEKTVAPSFQYLLRRRRQGDAHSAWFIMNLESWARAHSS